MGVSVAAIAPRPWVPSGAFVQCMLGVAPWFGTGITFFRKFCYLTVVAFQRQGIIYLFI